MAAAPNDTTQLQACVNRLCAGDESARGDLLKFTAERLVRLTRKMLADNPRVRRWEETGDVCQKAMIRLYRALEQVRPPTVRDFFRLAATAVRRELIDLARHYYGPEGMGRRCTGQVSEDSNSRDRQLAGDQSVDEPSRLAMWAEFHERVDQLPETEREVFDLLWYQGLKEEEAATLLKVSARTVQRRWQSARLRLHAALRDALPLGDV
jgi:RNA polymerase sigma-70 factor (ECF subfamily)